MKKIFILAGVGALLAGAYFASQLMAQQASAPGAAPQQRPATYLAVVNIGTVFNKFERALKFKEELEETLKPFKTKAKTLTDEMKFWHDEMQKSTFDPKNKDRYDAGIRNNKRQLEDMQLEVQKLIGKRQEDNLMTLWREVNQGVGYVAKTYGFQVVLAYGDPMEKEKLDLFPNINRKMQAMDGGSTIPLYIDPSVDISQIVVDVLNRSYKSPAGGVTPTGGSVTPTGLVK